MNANEAIIVDIDGTIAEHNGRGIFEYHRVGEDAPKPDIIRVINALCVVEDISVLYVTGRPRVCFDDTLYWLERHKLPAGPPNRLFMRDVYDHRHDYVIKKEIYEQHIKPYFHVMAVFEDRTRNVNMWRDLGLTCLQVAPGDF